MTWPTLILTTMEMVTLSTVYVKWVSETLLRPSGILFNTLCVPIIIVRVTLHPETPYISGIQIQTDSFCQRRNNVGATSATLDRRCSCTGCVAHPHGSEPRSTHWGSGSWSDKHQAFDVHRGGVTRPHIKGCADPLPPHSPTKGLDVTVRALSIRRGRSHC